MNKLLKEIGATPVTTSIIESLYPELKSPNKKVALLERQGYIIRLKSGLYVVNPEHSGKTLSTADIKQVKEDVLPFVRNPKELDIWSNDYFVQLANMVKIE